MNLTSFEQCFTDKLVQQCQFHEFHSKIYENKSHKGNSSGSSSVYWNMKKGLATKHFFERNLIFALLTIWHFGDHIIYIIFNQIVHSTRK